MRLLETRQTQERKKFFSNIHIYTHTDTHIHTHTYMLTGFLTESKDRQFLRKHESQGLGSALLALPAPCSLLRSPHSRIKPCLPDAQPALVLLPTAARAFPLSWPPHSWAPSDGSPQPFLQDSLVFHPVALYPLTSSFVVLRMTGHDPICLLIYYLPLNLNGSFMRSLFTSQCLSSRHCHIRSINADRMNI